MDLAYFYFAFSAAFNAFVSTVLGFFILFRDSGNKVNKTLALFSFSVALWSYAYILWPLTQDREMALLSFQLLHTPACFVSIFYLHFVAHWLGIYQTERLKIWVGYILSFYFACWTFSPVFISDMVPKFGMRFWAVPGMLYHYYLLMFFSVFLYSSYLLFKNYFCSSGVKKKQILLVLVGIGLSFLGGSTNYFLWYNINIPPYGNILASSFVIFSVYAIIRYNLLNIKLIATEGALLMMNTLLLFRFLISRNVEEFTLNIIIFSGSVGFSVLLIRSVKKEIQRREEIQKLAVDLKSANEKLVELDHAKSEFLSIAAHQLRTPLSVIKGYVSLLIDGDYGKLCNNKMRGVLGNIYKTNEHLVHLVDDFLSLARLESGRIEYSFKDIDLAEVVRQAAEEFGEKIKEKGLKLEYKIQKNLPQIWADAEKVHHVIFNFIDNAIKYSSKGILTVKLEKEDCVVTCSVEDNGIGMSKVDLENIFQKFYRGKNVMGLEVGGTGLGLYVCRRFIEAHNGRIWARSLGAGKGSVFGFTLPIACKTHLT